MQTSALDLLCAPSGRLQRLSAANWPPASSLNWSVAPQTRAADQWAQENASGRLWTLVDASGGHNCPLEACCGPRLF